MPCARINGMRVERTNLTDDLVKDNAVNVLLFFDQFEKVVQLE